MSESWSASPRPYGRPPPAPSPAPPAQHLRLDLFPLYVPRPPTLRHTARALIAALRDLPSPPPPGATAAAVAPLKRLWATGGRRARIALYAAGLIQALQSTLQAPCLLASEAEAVVGLLLTTAATTFRLAAALATPSAVSAVTHALASTSCSGSTAEHATLVRTAVALLQAVMDVAPAAAAAALWQGGVAPVCEAVGAHCGSSPRLATEAARLLAALARHVTYAQLSIAPVVRLLLPMATLYLSRGDADVTHAALDAIDAFPAPDDSCKDDLAALTGTAWPAAVVAALAEPATFLPAARTLVTSLVYLPLGDAYLHLGALPLLIEAALNGWGSFSTAALTALAALARTHVNAIAAALPLSTTLALLQGALTQRPFPPPPCVAALCALVGAAAPGEAAVPRNADTAVGVLFAALERFPTSLPVASDALAALCKYQDAVGRDVASGERNGTTLVRILAAHVGHEGVAVDALYLLSLLLRKLKYTTCLQDAAVGAGALHALKAVLEAYGASGSQASVSAATVLLELIIKSRTRAGAAVEAGLVGTLVALLVTHRGAVMAADGGGAVEPASSSSGAPTREAAVAVIQAAVTVLSELAAASSEARIALADTPGALGELASLWATVGRYTKATLVSTSYLLRVCAASSEDEAAALEAAGFVDASVVALYTAARLGDDAVGLVLSAANALIDKSPARQGAAVSAGMMTAVIHALQAAPGSAYVYERAAYVVCALTRGAAAPAAAAALLELPGALATLAAAMEAYAASVGPHNCHYIGAAMGALLAVHAAAATPGEAVGALLRQHCTGSIVACLQGNWAPPALRVRLAAVLNDVGSAADEGVRVDVGAAGDGEEWAQGSGGGGGEAGGRERWR